MSARATEPRLNCLHRPGKQGLGSATLAGMQWALEKSYDVFVTMDADWSHDPQHLPELVRATETADVASARAIARAVRSRAGRFIDES